MCMYIVCMEGPTHVHHSLHIHMCLWSRLVRDLRSREGKCDRTWSAFRSARSQSEMERSCDASCDCCRTELGMGQSASMVYIVTVAPDC